MGPNARKKPQRDGKIPAPMTHEEVDKLLRSPLRPLKNRREPKEEWIIKTEFPRRDFYWAPGGWSHGGGSASGGLGAMVVWA